MSLYPNRHRLALFSLKPLNEQAKKVANHPYNQHLTSSLPDGTRVLDIGFQVRSRSNRTLATLGRGDADIFVDGPTIAKVQCSFEIEPATNVVMLYDRSHGQTTQVFGDDATPFEPGRLRQVVVQKGLNSFLGMGGRAQNTVQFEFLWYQDFPEMVGLIKDRESIMNDCEENPRLARTADDVETVLPSQMQTRIHTAGPRQLTMRYLKFGKLGSGQFAVVYKALDVDTGKFLAVKIIQRPEQASAQAAWEVSKYYALKREVEHLSRISHPHIVDFITSQGWEGPTAEIFMGLKDGTLESLVKGGVPDVESIAKRAFYQMLQALDCLAANGIVHRDVKPENILYTVLPGMQYHFQLGDFGLSNRAIVAKSSVGTPLYMAPEVYEHGVQTHKMDVWSLFVTFAWVSDFDGFRQNLHHFTSLPQAREAILAMASRIGAMQEMARVNPDERASAAQILVKVYNGEGLTTQLNRIPPLTPTVVETRPEPQLQPEPMHQVRHRPTQGMPKFPKPHTSQFRVRLEEIFLPQGGVGIPPMLNSCKGFVCGRHLITRVCGIVGVMS
ncbi:Serine/threonine-protein kinase DCLK2 [Penicillium chrysogenum]|uniref:mitogen-activated protein kinase n=1 Tax=Penicillium chrysogenum TaxID=5076 RepID=A0A167PT10_PENCH|nr:Serine/threonine-protein kinase DCLK2 [Penicillium chrysogenum]